MDKDNKQLRKEKPFYKVWWYYLIIGVLLFGNIAVLVWMDDAVKPYWLTLISGWVSFIATITIGVIAYNQSERYKNENTRYEKAQEDRAWCQDKYIAINLYRERMNKFYLEFIDNSPIDIIEKYYILKSARAVAKEIGCDHSTIDNILNTNGVKRFTPAQQQSNPVVFKKGEVEYHFETTTDAAQWLMDNKITKMTNRTIVRQEITSRIRNNKKYFGFEVYYESKR